MCVMRFWVRAAAAESGCRSGHEESQRRGEEWSGGEEKRGEEERREHEGRRRPRHQTHTQTSPTVFIYSHPASFTFKRYVIFIFYLYIHC